MKNLSALLLSVGLVTISSAQAGTVTFSPSNMGTIDGTYYYTWGINWSLPSGDSITSATLTFNNIKLTAFGQSNPGILWSHLLSSGTTGVHTGTDNDNPSDAFSGHGALLGEAFFPHLNVGQTLTYNLNTATLSTDAADGNFGIGIDPDCHYTDSSIQLCINYGPTPQITVPEVGSTAVLLGSVLPALALLRRNKKA